MSASGERFASPSKDCHGRVFSFLATCTGAAKDGVEALEVKPVRVPLTWREGMVHAGGSRRARSASGNASDARHD